MHANKAQINENVSKAQANVAVQNQSVSEPCIEIEDNRPEAVAQRKLQMMTNNRLCLNQLKTFQCGVNSNVVSKQQQKTMANYQLKRSGLLNSDTTNICSIAQFNRGETKYGAMMGTDNQGPHTIAHSTIAAIESLFGYNPIQRYLNYREVGIILLPSEVENILENDRTEEDPDWLSKRFDAYLKRYQVLFGNCEFWYNESLRNMPKNVDEIEYSELPDEFTDALNELNLAITDIRDMHPESTYGGDLEFGATQEMLYGKGERSERQVTTAMSELERNDYTGLFNQIMQDADLGDLLSTDGVKLLAWHYVDLAIKGLGWDPR